ncbi:hypothetical protein F0562_024005 [Nyssa sinensis]|uniref:Uncharacterized protein n=1 Tax=Nyssa sinensis TaxID=561372 RepID=A0A5J5BI47_9ASTE|nr:hypothetical protein F0562_024005 [Nyssa sinensis]
MTEGVNPTVVARGREEKRGDGGAMVAEIFGKEDLRSGDVVVLEKRWRRCKGGTAEAIGSLWRLGLGWFDFVASTVPMVGGFPRLLVGLGSTSNNSCGSLEKTEEAAIGVAAVD